MFSTVMSDMDVDNKSYIRLFIIVNNTQTEYKNKTETDYSIGNVVLGLIDAVLNYNPFVLPNKWAGCISVKLHLRDERKDGRTDRPSVS